MFTYKIFNNIAEDGLNILDGNHFHIDEINPDSLILRSQNLSNEDFTIENGERVAQLVIAKHERAEWIEVNELSETSRGEGGFGSTGVK